MSDCENVISLVVNETFTCQKNFNSTCQMLAVITDYGDESPEEYFDVESKHNLKINVLNATFEFNIDKSFGDCIFILF